MTFIAREPKKINIRLIRKGKSYEAEEVLRRLRSFLDRNEAEPVKILRGFWKDQQDALSYGEIREAILSGHISEQTIKEWRQDYAKLVNDQFSHTWKNALAVGYKGQPIMDNLSSFHFDMQKPGVLSWIGERGAEFVTNESQTTKDAIRGLLMRSVTEKHSVDELSRVIRPLVGLNKPQAYANMRYYENVLNTLSDQHPRTSKEVIQRRAQEAAWKYAEKQHRERAYMIARTEMSFAYNRGAYEGIKQAQELGLMGAVVKIWSTSQGGNVCPDCEALEGEEVGMDGTFFESRGLFRGDNLVPPLHPRCECAIVYQEVSTKDVGGLKPAYAYDEYDLPVEERQTLRDIEDGAFQNDHYSADGMHSGKPMAIETFQTINKPIDNIPIVFNSDYSQVNPTYVDRFFRGVDFKTGNKTLEEYIQDSRLKNIKTVQEQYEKLNQMIESGAVSNKLRYQKQNQHLPGTKERAIRIKNDGNKKSSEFFEGVDILDLEKRQGKDVVIEFDTLENGKPIVKVYKSFDEDIGVVYNLNEEIKTNRIKIEYSEKGMHMYPVMGVL